MTINRREWLASVAAAAVARPPFAASSPAFVLFSKPIQGHSWKRLAQGAKQAGFSGIDLTTRPGGRVWKEDATIAKNYLSEDELQVLNRIVNLYLEYAELQALERKPMTMRDWIAKLDDFLRMSGREILTHAGKISQEQAVKKAELEFERHRALHANEPSQVENDFEEAIKKLPAPKPVKRAGKKK